MITGVAAADDVGFSSAIAEIKPTSETGDDPQSSGQKTGASQSNADPGAAVQGAALPYDGFGDRFAPESAQTLLDAQESLPVATRRSPGDGAPYTGTPESGTVASADKTPPEIDPRDTDRNGIVSFGEWRKDQGDKPLDTDQDGTVEFGEWLKSRNNDAGVSVGEDQPSGAVTAVDGSMFE